MYMTESEYSMPTQCPEGFDLQIWEVVKDKELEDSFLLLLADELKKQKCSIRNVCKCLNLRLDQDPDEPKCFDFHTILSRWRHNTAEEIVSVGKLICELNTLKCKSLCNLCMEFFKTHEGDKFRHPVQESIDSHSVYSRSGEVTFPELQLKDHDQQEAEAVFSELVHGRIATPKWLHLRNYQESLANVDVVPLAQGDERVLEVDEKDDQLCQVIEAMQKKFASLIRLAYTSFKNKPVPIDELQVYLSQRCADERQKIPLFEKRMNDIIHQSTHSQVFMLLSRIRAWDFLDFSLLEDAVKEFDLSELNPELASYTQAVCAFQSDTKLVDFLKVWKSSCLEKELPACEILIAKCAGDMKNCTLADVAKKARIIANKFNLLTLAARLGWANPGSVYLLWYIPEAVSKHIEMIMKSKNRPNLVSYGIQQLVVGNRIYKDCGVHTFADTYHASITDPDYFFGNMGKRILQWVKPFEKAYNCRIEDGTTKIEWFSEGKLNVSVNCLDRHDGSKVALLWEPPNQEPEQLTYRQLLEMTCKVANVLKSYGVNRRDRVIIYMPAMPLTVASMLACARMGAQCTDFDAKALKERIIGTQAKCIITANERVVAADQVNQLKSIVDEAMEDSKIKNLIHHVFVAKRTETDILLVEKHDVDLDKAMRTALSEFAPEEMDSEDELLISYTSGTGKKSPRGIVHTQAGFLFNVALMHKFMFNGQPGDVFGCVADLGWMAGHTCVVYGPLCNGETTVLFEGLPWKPHPGRYWEMVQRLKITHFYTIPCVLQKLKSKGDEHVDRYDLTSLKVIAVAGEPLQQEIEDWYFNVIGKKRCLLIDAWGQTELAGMGLMHWRAPDGRRPAQFPADKSFPLFGVDPVIEPGKGSLPAKENEVRGALYLKKPIPSMGRKVIDHSSDEGVTESLFSDYYFKKGTQYYETFDMVRKNSDGEQRVIGRTDNSIRIKGVDWMPNEVAEQVSANMNMETKKKLQCVEVCELQGDENELCVIMQAKRTVKETEKEDIVKDVNNAYHKGLKPLDDNRRLRFVFTDGVPVTLSGKMSFYQLIRLCKAKLLGQDTGLGDSCYKNIDVQQALTEFGTTVMRRVSFSS